MKLIERPMGYSVERYDSGRIGLWWRRQVSSTTGHMSILTGQGVLSQAEARELRDALMEQK